MPSVITQTQVKGAPIEFDLLEGDLDKHFPNFSDGHPLWWGIAVSAVSNAWEDTTTLQGVDWVVELHPPKSLKVPKPKGSHKRTGWTTIATTCALLAVRTDETVLNTARNKGRLAVRRLAALIRRELPALLLDSPLWEGAIAGLKDGEQSKIRMMVTTRTMEIVKSRPPETLHEIGMRLLPVEFGRLPPNLGKALEWLALARSANVSIEKFSHLWLSVIALINYESSDLTQKARIDAYVKRMSDILRGSERAALASRLKEAYDIRNELWHEAKEARITTTLLSSLEEDAFSLVDFEFIRVGRPIPQ